MLAAVNQVFEHEGRQYHINCEDFGFEVRTIAVRILDQGGILWEKVMPYQTDKQEDERREAERAVGAQMAKTVQTVRAAIAAGRLP